MGQCMELKTSTIMSHPLLGGLQQLQKDEVTYLVLTFPIINEEEYISLSKDIHKLKYNLELKDHLYLPSSENFVKSSVFCETFSRLELLLPTYLKDFEQMLQESTRMNTRFSQLQIWYLLLLSTKYLRHFTKKGGKPNLSPSHFVVLDDGSLKIIPDVLIPKLDMNNQILNLNRSLKKINSESTAYSQGQVSVVQKLGLICLTAATLASYQDLVSQNGSHFERKPRIEALITSCKPNYSVTLIDVLSYMLLEEKQNEKATIEAVYNLSGQYQGEIKAKLGSGIPFGEFQVEPLRQTNRMFQLGTPKHSRIGPQSEYHKHSFDLKDNQDAIIQKPDQIVSPTEHYLTIL